MIVYKPKNLQIFYRSISSISRKPGLKTTSSRPILGLSQGVAPGSDYWEVFNEKEKFAGDAQMARELVAFGDETWIKWVKLKIGNSF